MNRFSIHTLFFCIILLGYSSPTLHAQQDSVRPTISETLKADGNVILSDAGNIILSPLHFDSREWIATGAVIGTAVILISVDHDTRKLAQKNESDFGNKIFDVGREFGREIYGLSLGGGLYLGGLAFNDNSTRETGLMLIESISFAGAATNIIKIIVGRSRPYTEDGPRTFQPFHTATDFTSMPSGHSTVAFAFSSLLSERIHNPFATAGLYSIATLTAFSRVYHDAHWFSDTFIGAAIGTFMGMTIARLHEHKDQQTVYLYPTLNGLRAEIKF